ncbi:alpha-2,3-sialyltransferase, partial [Campylobacter jejuni]
YYSDYESALKEKEGFVYKLGQIIIKAHKNWHKGGYIMLWFEVKKLKKEFKKGK